MEVTTESGSSYRAEHVIVTLPLGVLKHDHGQLFYPGLGKEKVGAIERVGEGRISKIFVEWDEPWWVGEEVGIHLAWSREELEGAQLPSDWFRLTTF